jgi:hypothetical protein
MYSWLSLKPSAIVVAARVLSTPTEKRRADRTEPSAQPSSTVRVQPERNAKQR